MREAIQSMARIAAFRQELADLLLELCRIDTTPRADVGDLAAAERAVFDRIERALAQIGHVRFRRPGISTAIEGHPFYSQPYYTRSKARPLGLGAGEAYVGRSNLVVEVDGPGAGVAMNAHVDVVKPYIPPRIEGGTLYGRGACDDKGPAVAMIGAMKLLAAAGAWPRRLTAMFVIEEEMGGNGSLSLALDRELRSRFDSLAVLECTGSKIHPGNRGAVWYKVEGRLPGVNLFEASAFIVEEMENEGRALKAESAHALFPHRPVQTCHGVIGSFGEHPSRICGRVDFRIGLGARWPENVRGLIVDVLEDGLREYVGGYGDKTNVVDRATGRPKVDHHYDLAEVDGGLDVRVHGSAGHMGSIMQNDGAITKMAAMVRSLVASRGAIERRTGSAMQLGLVNWADASHLVMEGGQGFVPTHEMPEVMERLRRAVWRGAERYLSMARAGGSPDSLFRVTFEKLHNAAFAGDADSSAVRSAIAAAQDAGLWKDEPILGWDVSCDARIFAKEYPDLPVITMGPGKLIHAHADDEQIDLDELARFAEMLAHFIFRQTGP